MRAQTKEHGGRREDGLQGEVRSGVGAGMRGESRSRDGRGGRNVGMTKGGGKGSEREMRGSEDAERKGGNRGGGVRGRTRRKRIYDPVGVCGARDGL